MAIFLHSSLHYPCLPYGPRRVNTASIGVKLSRKFGVASYENSF
jgi:hypothetical protein